MTCDCWFPCSCVYWSLVKVRIIVWECQVIDSSSITQSEALWVWRCDVTTSNSIQYGGALVVNILVFDLRVQLQHCTYQRKTLLFALIKVSTFICKREILDLSSPLRPIYMITDSGTPGSRLVDNLLLFFQLRCLHEDRDVPPDRDPSWSNLGPGASGTHFCPDKRNIPQYMKWNLTRDNFQKRK